MLVEIPLTTPAAPKSAHANPCDQPGATIVTGVVARGRGVCASRADRLIPTSEGLHDRKTECFSLSLGQSEHGDVG